jgi:tetratricopeptide (TPR) repeat protein
MQQNNTEPNFCFVLSPASKSFINLWDAVLEPAIVASGMKAVRTSDISERYDNVMDGIRKHIMDAKVIVAVLDDDGLSVMYELGLAHAAKKHVIIMLEEYNEVPQVFSHLSILRYDSEDFPNTRKELSRRLQTVNSALAEDLFPELPIRSQAEWEEYRYLKLTRKTLTIKVAPRTCSIFFNNKFLGASPQTIYVNPDAERNVVSISASDHFEHYQVLSADDIQQYELKINLEHRDVSKYPKRVNTWLMLRRQDPDNPVLSRAIGNYLKDQGDLDDAREEAQFCITKAPEWFGGYNLFGFIEGELGNHDKAIEFYRQVGRLNPENHLSPYNIACSQSLSGNYEAALSELNKIITTQNMRNSFKETFKLKKPPYFFETDKDFDPLRKNAKYNKAFKKIILQLVNLVESPEPSLIPEPTPNKFHNPKTPVPLPYAIKNFVVESFQCIKRLELRNIPIDSPWIFITGDNADGKTSVLQALAIGLSGTKDAENLLNQADTDCKIDVEISVEEQSQLRHFYWAEDHWRLEDVLTGAAVNPCDNLLGYGPARLDMQGERSLKDEREQNGPLHSLLQQNGNLLNIESWLKDQALELTKAKDEAIFQRMEKVKALLVKLMPNVSAIKIDGSHILYQEKGYEIEAHHLSAGHKSILTMIGDMVIRFYQTQKEVIDPSELKGIVMIDELDVHLHPRWQKQLPTLLSETFPKVQFIVSTHSVIPFLGAPPNSVFLKVKRDSVYGTTVKKLKIDIANLLPNAILTSPLFDMDEITNSHNSNFAAIRTEDNFSEIERRDQRDARLKELAKKLNYPN